MRSASPVSATATPGSSPTGPEGLGSTVPNLVEQRAGDHEQAARGPIPEPVSAAENPAPALPADSPAEARGRRTLSTAFVMVGPDGHLTVELRDGRVLVIRDVVMRPKDYCGAQVLGSRPGGRYCGEYADVAAARPGGAPVADEPGTTVAGPVGPGPGSFNRE